MTDVDVTCPECGSTFIVKVRRHNKRGQGAHYANEIKKLGAAHMDVLRAIDDRHAIDYESGLTLSDITFAVNGIRKGTDKRNLKDQTVAGRLSELQGLGVISCVPAETILVDRDAMKFENANTPRWYRVSASLMEAMAR